jgi:hypothetical protein
MISLGPHSLAIDYLSLRLSPGDVPRSAFPIILRYNGAQGVAALLR